MGPTRAKALITHFGSLAQVKKASVDELALVPGIGRGTAQSIHIARARDVNDYEAVNDYAAPGMLDT